MGSSDKTVKVTLIAVAQPYVKGVTEAGAATTKLGKEIDGVGGKAKGAEGALGGAGAALKGMAVAGAAVAGTALVAFLRDSVKAAGDLEQSVGGVDAVFKDSAAAVHEFGKNSAEAVGLSRNEFNELITVTGALLKNKGLEDFTGKSLDLVKVGADLAATFGGPTSQAVEALNAAMRGESNPIERYGITLNESAVNAELASKGLSKLTGSALEQAKAQARLDIITRQSADAHGKFAGEANTLQGQQQRLNAEWENAKAELGGALLPAVTAVVGAMRAGLDVVLAAKAAWENIPGPIQAAVVALIAFRVAQTQLVAVGTGATSIVKGLGEAISYARMASVDAGGGMAGLGAGLRTLTGSASLAGSAMGGLKSAGSALMGLAGGPWGLAIAGLTMAIGAYAQAQANAKRAAEEFAATLDKTTGKLTAASRELAAQKFFKDFAQADYSRVADSLERAGVSLSNFIAAQQGGAEKVAEFNKRFDEWRMSAEAIDLAQQGSDIGALGNAFASTSRDIAAATEVSRVNADTQKKVAEATGAVAPAAEDATRKTKTLSEAVAEYFKTATGATDSTNAYIAALRGISSPILDAREAERKWTESIAAAEKALKENGFTLDGQTQKGRDNQRTLDDMSRSALDNVAAMAANGASQTQLQAALTGSQRQIEAMAVRFGMSKDAAAAYAASVINIPKSVDTLIKADAGQAKLSVQEIATLLAQIDGKQATTYIRTVKTAVSMDSSATGYNKAAGGHIRGPGTSTSDSIPAMLSDGEYVIRTKAVDHYGLDFMHRINAMRFADGGFVSRSAPVASPATSLVGMAIEGTIDMGNGLWGHMRAVVRDEMTSVARDARVLVGGGR